MIHHTVSTSTIIRYGNVIDICYGLCLLFYVLWRQEICFQDFIGAPETCVLLFPTTLHLFPHSKAEHQKGFSPCTMSNIKWNSKWIPISGWNVKYSDYCLSLNPPISGCVLHLQYVSLEFFLCPLNKWICDQNEQMNIFLSCQIIIDDHNWVNSVSIKKKSVSNANTFSQILFFSCT